ncbi:hypothetical protein SADUNF_Sadunf08G0118400 [Salix dunnii]|uniref:Uncharacterized protein n=1 Tax=Salix dunnii TaxID=1413687 RepID=A0A835MST4_9ROSI|nr:hypothetical protein SADUNF_Sadunf08G0118400 [Salix dunnii]
MLKWAKLAIIYLSWRIIQILGRSLIELNAIISASGPGSSLLEPFPDELVSLRSKKLLQQPLSARASLLWAQNYVDQDRESSSSNLPN